MGVLDPLLGLFGRGDADGAESAADAEPTDGDADDDAPAETPAGFSERAEALSVHAAGAVLDFSVESLADLDEMAADEDAAGREAKLTYGSYLGEVLVREFGGEWVDDDGWGVRVSQGDDETTVAVFEGAKMSLTEQPVFQKVVDKLVEGGAEPVDAGPTDVDDAADDESGGEPAAASADDGETDDPPETADADAAEPDEPPDGESAETADAAVPPDADTDEPVVETAGSGAEADDVAPEPPVDAGDIDGRPDGESTEAADADEEYTSVVSPVDEADESAADVDEEPVTTDDGDDSVTEANDRDDSAVETGADEETSEGSAAIPTYDDYQPVETSVETDDGDESEEYASPRSPVGGSTRSAEERDADDATDDDTGPSVEADEPTAETSGASDPTGDDEDDVSAVSPDDDGCAESTGTDEETGDAPVEDDVIPTFEERPSEPSADADDEPTAETSEGSQSDDELTSVVSPVGTDEDDEADEGPERDRSAEIPTFEERPSEPSANVDDEATTETREESESNDEPTSVVSRVGVDEDDEADADEETNERTTRDRSAEIPTFDERQSAGADAASTVAADEAPVDADEGPIDTDTGDAPVDADVQSVDDVIPTFEEPPSNTSAETDAGEAAADVDEEDSPNAEGEYASVVSPVDESDDDEAPSAVEEAETTPVVPDAEDDAKPTSRPGPDDEATSGDAERPSTRGDADERSPGPESERASRGDRATGLSSSPDRGPADGISRLPFRTAARAFADDWSDREFDFTPTSLLRLDAFIDALWSGRFSRRALEERSIDPDATDDPLTRVGAYYGETLVANFEAAWVRTDAGEPAVEVVDGGESETVRVYEAARDCLVSPSTFRFRYDALANRLGDDGPRARRVRDSGFDLDAGSAEVVTALIADAERFAEAWPDYDLDYSAPSLRRVERLLALEFGGYDVSEAEVGTETDHASLCLTDVARAAAAYVAVVFVRHLDAQWHVGERVTLVASTTAGERRIDPVALTAARLREERSLSEWYDDCREELDIDASSTRERGD